MNVCRFSELLVDRGAIKRRRNECKILNIRVIEKLPYASLRALGIETPADCDVGVGIAVVGVVASL